MPSGFGRIVDLILFFTLAILAATILLATWSALALLGLSN